MTVLRGSSAGRLNAASTGNEGNPPREPGQTPAALLTDSPLSLLRNLLAIMDLGRVEWPSAREARYQLTPAEIADVRRLAAQAVDSLVASKQTIAAAVRATADALAVADGELYRALSNDPELRAEVKKLRPVDATQLRLLIEDFRPKSLNAVEAGL